MTMVLTEPREVTMEQVEARQAKRGDVVRIDDETFGLFVGLEGRLKWICWDSVDPMSDAFEAMCLAYDGRHNPLARRRASVA